MNFDKIVNAILNENTLKSRISNEKIAKKHNVDIATVERLLKQGSKIEHEHTKDQKAAETIASQHIYEVLDYYKKLKKVEK
jgi:hypothetical protein